MVTMYSVERRQKEMARKPSRNGGGQKSFVVFLLFLCGIVGVCLVYLNQKREIAQIEANIVSCRKALENLKPQLANCRTQVEALKGKRVVEYAVQRGMSRPDIGQVCDMSSRRRNANRMIAGKEASGSSNLSMATITPSQNR